jgi:hypothetical protein
MIYREQLPDDCPPIEAGLVEENLDVFRLVRQSPPTDSDFQSQRAEKPDAVFNSVSECIARGLSVFTDRRDCERASKLPALRGRHLCRVRLTNGAGSIEQTGRPSHHTWWPFAEFAILPRCVVESR